MRDLYRRLGRVIGMRPRTIQQRVIEGVAETPYSNVTIKTDVDPAAFNFLRERKERFPGIAVEKLYLRNYPHDELGAQLFGTLREISPKELKQRRYRGVAQGTRIGASGIEYSYDPYLRGRDGYTKVVINALGNRDDRRETTRVEPKQGSQLRLSLDLDLQAAANSALKRVDRGRRGQRLQGRRLRGDGPAQRRGAGAGLLPELRRQRVRQAALAAQVRLAELGGQRRAAVQPRDRRHLSDRLDLQARDRHGRAPGGPDHAVLDDRGLRRVQARRPRVQERPATPCSARCSSRAR